MKSSKNYKIWTTGNGPNVSLGDTKAGNGAVLNAFPPSQSKVNLKSGKGNDKDSSSDNETIKESFISFTYGVISSFLIVAGTACVQVRCFIS